MSDRLPPLTALRAFEAAARHMSFASAASELNVTPAALSFQIKSLEEHLGKPVFRRLNRKVELTAEGVALYPGIAEGFEAIQNAWTTTRRRMEQGHLTVTTGPAFMTAWLAPRVSKFVAEHPEMKLRLTASLKLLSFLRDGIDVALRFGPGDDDEGYFSEVLFEDWSTPMAIPAVAEQLTAPKDLLKQNLIGMEPSERTYSQVEQWEKWFEAIAIETPSVQGPYFSAPDAAIRYALNGSGFVLARISLAEPFLVSGQLVMPFRQSLKRGIYCRLVCPKGYELDDNVMVFRDWIKQEISSLTRFEEGRIFV